MNRHRHITLCSYFFSCRTKKRIIVRIWTIHGFSLRDNPPCNPPGIWDSSYTLYKPFRVASMCLENCFLSLNEKDKYIVYPHILTHCIYCVFQHVLEMK